MLEHREEIKHQIYPTTAGIRRWPQRKRKEINPRCTSCRSKAARSLSPNSWVASQVAWRKGALLTLRCVQFQYSIHTILYVALHPILPLKVQNGESDLTTTDRFQRGVYPAEDFTAVKKYGLNMLGASIPLPDPRGEGSTTYPYVG